MDFWYYLATYGLVGVMGWVLGWFMGYERGNRRWR